MFINSTNIQRWLKGEVAFNLNKEQRQWLCMATILSDHEEASYGMLHNNQFTVTWWKWLYKWNECKDQSEVMIQYKLVTNTQLRYDIFMAPIFWTDCSLSSCKEMHTWWCSLHFHIWRQQNVLELLWIRFGFYSYTCLERCTLGNKMLRQRQQSRTWSCRVLQASHRREHEIMGGFLIPPEPELLTITHSDMSIGIC